MITIDFDIISTVKNYIRIPKSNSLLFRRTDIQSGYKQNKDDYNIYDSIFPEIIDHFEGYYQKFTNSGDNASIFNQFAIITDYDDIDTVELYKYSSGSWSLDSDLTSDLTNPKGPTEMVTYGNVKWYNHIINTSTLGGYYRLIITTDLGYTYRSNSFYIFTMTDKDGVFIQCYNDSDSPFGDGIHYDGTNYPGWFMDGTMYPAEPGSEKQIYDSWDYEPEMLGGKPLRFDIFNYGAVQWFMWEKLNIALCHDHFFINEVEYKSDETLNNEQINKTYYNHGSIKLRAIGYESYAELTEVTEPEGTIIGVGTEVIGVGTEIIGTD